MKHDSEYSDFSSFMRVYFKQLQRYIVPGIRVWVPLFITVWVTWWFVSKIGVGLEAIMGNVQTYLNNLGRQVSALDFLEHFSFASKPATLGTGFLVCVLLFLCTGFLTRYIIGRKIIATGELIVGKIPLISRVYLAVQQIRDVFVNREGAVFQKVVLVEYPRKGLWAVGFITSSEHGIVQETAGKKLTAVFVPTTPNPTSGFLLYFPPDELVPIEMSIEDAMKLIVSGGAFIPGRPSALNLEEEPDSAKAGKAMPQGH